MRIGFRILHTISFCLVFAGLLFPASLPATAQAKPLPSADEVMTAVKAQASAEHKVILLVFSASWCAPCHMFEGFLEDPKIKLIVEKTFVVGHLDVGEHANDKRHSNSPGGEDLKAKLGGHDAGFPYLIMLDAAGQPIIDSLRPDKHSKGGVNIGYPDSAAEIDWFMQMLTKSAPTLSPQDTKTIHNWLTSHSSAG